MDFTKLTETFGFGQAVVACWEKLSEETKREFTPWNWVEIFWAAEEGADLAKVALDKIGELDDCLNWFGRALYPCGILYRPDSDSMTAILDRMWLVGAEPEKWFDVARRHSREGDGLEKLVLLKLKGIERPFQVWFSFLKLSGHEWPQNSQGKFRKIVTEKAVGSSSELSTWDELSGLLKELDGFPEWELKIAARAEKVADDNELEHWISLFWVHENDRWKRGRMIAKMKKVAIGSFDRLVRFYGVMAPFENNSQVVQFKEREEAKEWALIEAEKVVGTFWGCTWLIDRVKNSRDFVKLRRFVKRAVDFASTGKEWGELCYEVGCHCGAIADVGEYVVDRMIDGNDDFDTLLSALCVVCDLQLGVEIRMRIEVALLSCSSCPLDCFRALKMMEVNSDLGQKMMVKLVQMEAGLKAWFEVWPKVPVDSGLRKLVFTRITEKVDSSEACEWLVGVVGCCDWELRNFLTKRAVAFVEG